MLAQKQAIYNALSTSQDLINLNLNIKISTAWPDTKATYPYITYYQLSGAAQLVDGQNSLLKNYIVLIYSPILKATLRI
jgi:hypothetical protein